MSSCLHSARLLGALLLACSLQASGQQISRQSLADATNGRSSSGAAALVESFGGLPLQVEPTASGVRRPAVSSLTVAVTGPVALQFIPVTPCRIADTRSPGGPFGGPELAANTSRAFDIPQSACNIPSTAVAYSLNVTVVPNGSLNYLTLWPSGETRPYVSTLNSYDGRVKANAAITPAGTNGGVGVFVSDATNVILDIDGYFVPAGTASALAFYPVTPCRVADTRGVAGPLGGPSISANNSRAFPVQSGSCDIPSTAKAYSLNLTAVPRHTLNYLTTWQTGQAQPNVSTLNSPTGAVVANAAIVPAGTGGDLSIFVSDDADVILDINGYFAPLATGGLSLYAVTPCRVIDTRPTSFSGTLVVNVEGSACAPPSTAKGYVLNATVVPPGPLNYLTLWPDAEAQPDVSTLNADDGAITSNMAIVPTNNGRIDAYAYNLTNLILDISSYFAPTTMSSYVLTVNSANPASGVAIGVAPADNNGATNGTTSFTRTYNAGRSVTLTAPATSGSYGFVSWTGCASSSTVTCTVTMSANTTVTANYNEPAIVSVSVTPNQAVTIGATQQFTATVTGTGSFSKGVTWSLAGPSGSSLNPGTLSTSGLYTTPYPAPATVTITATSTQDTTKSGSVTVPLSAPAATTGPALTVDAGNQTGAISPEIYGMNGYVLDTTTATNANITVVRWGGDNTSRYNYKTYVTNSAADYYFENQSNASFLWPTGYFNDLVTSAATYGIKVLGTVPVQGWVSNSDSTGAACSFPLSIYPDQYSVDSSRGCGNGEYANQTEIPDASGTAAITSISEPPPVPPAASAVTAAWAKNTWTGSWVNSLVSQFGQGNPSGGNGKGVAGYDLDNEPAWWDAVHRDVHPNPSTYDEVTNGGIGTALAIKTIDPTAEVNGPVVDYWWNYFYSKQDIESGWSSGPCYSPWSNPVDREAHGGVPFIEHYLRQFKAAETTYGKRLLDYVDIHTYFAANYPAGSGRSVAFTTAGNTGEQQTRLNSTRVFWDPTYTDSSNNYPQPNYPTDPNYTTSCSPPQQAPQLIPMMQGWVNSSYPGTRTAITEYNFGGMEAINGALAEADILGIFGSYHLDLATLWPTTNYSAQVPGTMAFEIYRNYDGNKSTFGNEALASTSADQGKLSVYGALRTSDNAITVVVINKTYGDLTSTLSVANLTPNGKAQVFLYSNANLAGIIAKPAVTVTPPAKGSTTSTISATFPAQSITLFVVPTV